MNRTTTVETTTKSGLRGPGPTLITRTKITNRTRTTSRGTMRFGSRRKPSTAGTTFVSGAKPFTGTRSSAGNRFRGSSKFNRRRIETGTRANAGTTSGPRATSRTETSNIITSNGGATSSPRITSRTGPTSNAITTDEGTTSSPRITSRTGTKSNTITTDDGTTTNSRTTTRTRTTTEAVPLPDEQPKVRTRFNLADRPDHSSRYNVKQIFDATLQYVKEIQLVSSDPKVKAVAVAETAIPTTGAHTNDETKADAGTTTTTKSHPSTTTSHPSTTTTRPGTTTNGRTTTTRGEFNGETTTLNVGARPNGSTRLNGRTRVNGGTRLNSGTEVNGGTAGARLNSGTRANGRTTRIRVNGGTTGTQPNSEASVNSGRRLNGRRRVNGGTVRNRINGGVRPTVGARTPTRTVIRTSPLSKTTTPETTSNPDTTAQTTFSTRMPGRWLTVGPRNGAATRGHSRRPPTVTRVDSGVQPNPLTSRTSPWSTRTRSTMPSILPETSLPNTTPSPTPGARKWQTPSAKLSP